MIIVHCTSHFVDSRNLFVAALRMKKVFVSKALQVSRINDVVHSHADLSLPTIYSLKGKWIFVPIQGFSDINDGEQYLSSSP